MDGVWKRVYAAVGQQSSPPHTFAEFAVNQGCCSCECLGGVVKLAKCLELDNLNNVGGQHVTGQHTQQQPGRLISQTPPTHLLCILQ